MAGSDVVLGAAMRTNLLSLQNTQRSIDTTQLRLATGKKVNSALDNPQSFFQSQSLNNRASDLTRLLDGIGQSIRTLEEADKGITALTSLVEQASSVAEEAQSEIRAAEGIATIQGTKDLRSVTDLTTQSGGAIAANDVFRISFRDADINGGAVVNGANITITAGQDIYDVVAAINGDASVTGTSPAFNKLVRASVDSQGRLKIESLEEGAIIRVGDSGAAQSLGPDGYTFLGLDGLVTGENNGTAAGLRQNGTAVAGRTLTSSVAATASKVNGQFVASATLGGASGAGFVTTGTYATGGADDFTISVRIDDTTYNIATQYNETNTIQSVIDGINSSGAGEFVTASFNTTSGRIELAFDDGVGTAEIAYTAEAGGTTSFGFGTGAADAAIAVATGISSEAFRFIGSSANLDQYTKDFNKLRGQIDDIVKDANYRGVNLLSGDNMTSYFNEDRSSTLVTEGSDFTAAGLGVDKADFLDAKSIEKSLNQVRNALDSVRAFGSSIANDLSIIQTRRDFTEQTINTLKAGAADLTDADLNEEGANLLALQTAQQLGVTSLSLASQSQQSVLRLF